MVVLALAGCAATSSPREIKIYDLGKLTVVVYPDVDSLIDRLDPIRRLVMESVGGKIYGYVENPTLREPQGKPTIHTIDDLSNFFHELKHYLAPEWKHPYGCATKDSCLEPFVTRKAIEKK